MATQAKVITTTTQDSELTIALDNGKTIKVDINDLTPAMINTVALHGLKQKIVDAAAGLGTTTEKYNAMREVADRIIAGEWNKRGEGSAAPTGLLLKALVRLYPSKPVDALKEYIAGKDKTEQAALRKNPKIAAMIETIKAESAKTGGVDSDALLDELDEI